MTNELTLFDESEYRVMQNMAKTMVDSGFFTDVKQVAQAMVKIQAGREIGIPPFAAMSGIHIVQSKPVLGANLIATLVKNDPRYDYRVKQADTTACVLAWYENGRAVGDSSFTMQEAQAAGLAGKDNWKKYASDMLFARALTRGARRYAPGIFGGAPIYTPDELGVDTDEDGHIVTGQVTIIEQPPQSAPPSGPLPDDEQVVSEAPAKEFIPIAASLLETDADAVKARLKALGYERIPGKPAERVTAYKRLKSDLSTAAQDDLFGDEYEARQAELAAKATAQGQLD